MRIQLIRHGEVHNPRDILYGRLPGFALSAKGVQQAQDAGRFLQNHPIAALYTSPLLRARQTASYIRQHLNGVRIQTSSLLNEVRTPFEGLPAIQVHARKGDFYTGADPQYEQPTDVLNRLRSFMWRQRRLLGNQRKQIAAVTHGDVIAFAALWALGWIPAAVNKSKLMQAGLPEAYPAHASITTLIFKTDRKEEIPQIVYWRPGMKR
jgi:probable phosphoglycerate mutase